MNAHLPLQPGWAPVRIEHIQVTVGAVATHPDYAPNPLLTPYVPVARLNTGHPDKLEFPVKKFRIYVISISTHQAVFGTYLHLKKNYLSNTLSTGVLHFYLLNLAALLIPFLSFNHHEGGIVFFSLRGGTAGWLAGGWGRKEKLAELCNVAR